MATITLGGKAGWTPAPWLLLEAGQTLLEEPLAPLADDLPRQVEARTNLVVRQSIGRIEDDLRSNYVSIR